MTYKGCEIWEKAIEIQQIKSVNNISTESVLFIPYIVNCSNQVRHKTEKVNIIVKGARKFLGIKDLFCKLVNRRLETDGKPGVTGERGI